jgi:transcriptional antiterminator NusG
MSDTDITPEDLIEQAPAPEAEASMPGDVGAEDAAGDVVVEEEVVADTIVEASTEVVDDEVATESPAEAAPVEETAPAEAAESSDVGDEDELFVEEAPVRARSPFDRPGRWYVVHTQSGHEKKAQQNLAARTASMNMEERIYESVIPMEDVVEFKNGKKVVVQKKMFPGYLLVRAELDDDAWYVVRNTPSVVNFVGSGGKPAPLPRREVENFLAEKEEGTDATPTKRTKARLEYEMGETVRVKEGPFADFSGEIVEINEDQLKVKVLVNIFGRETPVELEFSQIARL